MIVTLLNAELGLPEKLGSREFDADCFTLQLIWHSTLLDFPIAFWIFYSLNENPQGGFFQDEYQYCQERFDFINKFKIDLVYSLFTQENASRIYLQNTSCTSVHYTLPGYVSETLVQKSSCYLTDNKQREIDVGYRSRTLGFFMGKGAQENQILERYLLKNQKHRFGMRYFCP